MRLLYCQSKGITKSCANLINEILLDIVDFSLDKYPDKILKIKIVVNHLLYLRHKMDNNILYDDVYDKWLYLISTNPICTFQQHL